MNHDPWRRLTVDRMTPAERAIYDAQVALEQAGADPRLTRAAAMLALARELVADVADGVEPLP